MTRKQFEELKAQLADQYKCEEYDENIFYHFGSVEDLKNAYDMVADTYNAKTSFGGWLLPKYVYFHKRDGEWHWECKGYHGESSFDMAKIADDGNGVALCSIKEIHHHFYEALYTKADEDDEYLCQLFAREKETAEVLIRKLGGAEKGKMLYCEDEANQSYADAWEVCDRHVLGYSHDTHNYLIGLDLSDIETGLED